MHLKKIVINNFRLLKDFELDIKENMSLIVGKNNCGKTSISTILEKFSNPKSENFRWDDFNLEFQNEFYVKVYSHSDKENHTDDGIRMTLFIKYTEADSYANIQNFMMDLNPLNDMIILEFFYFCPFDKLNILIEELKNKDIKRDEKDKFTKFMIKNSNRFFISKSQAKGYDTEKKEIINELSSEVSTTEIKKLINFHAIKANRDVSNKTNDNSLSSLSAKYYELKNSKDPEKEIFNELSEVIEKTDTHLNEVYNGNSKSKVGSGIFSDIIKNVKRFGGISDETKISVQSSIGSKDLLNNNTTLYYEHNGKFLPENYNGLGYLNLIGMIFEIETAIEGFHKNINENPSDINLLFIEEPEAHTHPQLQYIFIKNIKELIKEKSENLNIQTLLTTHSSHIIADCDFNDIRYLKKEKSAIKALNFESLNKKYSDEEAFKFVKKYLTLNHAELFFADKVIFIEGATERVLLPTMMNKIDKECVNGSLPLLSQNISTIEAGAYSHKFKPLIEFLGLKTLIITDIDGVKKSASNKYVKCPSDEAKYTSNSALKDFFGLEVEEEHFETLKSKTFDEKLIGEKIRIAYQITENDYHARSFEDAFIALNLEFIRQVLNKDKDNFKESLKNVKKFNDNEPNYYNLAENCIKDGGKSLFAIDLLYYDGIDDKEWLVPKYIKEGLEWLRDI